MKTALATKEPEQRELLLYQPVGYYERDGVWYGPCVGVYIWKRKVNEQAQ